MERMVNRPGTGASLMRHGHSATLGMRTRTTRTWTSLACWTCPNTDERRAAVAQSGHDELCTPRSRVPEAHYWPASPAVCCAHGSSGSSTITKRTQRHRLQLPCEDGACIVHCYFEPAGIPPPSPPMVEHRPIPLLQPLPPAASPATWQAWHAGMEDVLQPAGMRIPLLQEDLLLLHAACWHDVMACMYYKVLLPIRALPLKMTRLSSIFPAVPGTARTNRTAAAEHEACTLPALL